MTWTRGDFAVIGGEKYPVMFTVYNVSNVKGKTMLQFQKGGFWFPADVYRKVTA